LVQTEPCTVSENLYGREFSIKTPRMRALGKISGDRVFVAQLDLDYHGKEAPQ
jgi:hypothetical protein